MSLLGSANDRHLRTRHRVPWSRPDTVHARTSVGDYVPVEKDVHQYRLDAWSARPNLSCRHLQGLVAMLPELKFKNCLSHYKIPSKLF